jgi:amino acid adenylation domain-containing protein
MKTVLDQIGQLSPEKIRLLAQAINKKKMLPSGPLLQRHPGQTEYPLSFGQERLWFLDQLVPGNAAYNWPFAVRFGFELDPEVFRRTLTELARRHEVLRTTYHAVGNMPVQRIAPPAEVQLKLLDLQTFSSSEGEAEAMRIIGEDARTGFNLRSDPLCRYLLIQLGPADWIFGGTMHHSIGDAWSRKVLMEEISAIWMALSMGRQPQLPELPVQYGDYAIWQREWLQGETGEQLLSYWKRQLKDVPALELFTDHPRPAVMSFQGATEAMSLSKPLTEGLRTLGKQEGATLFMTLLAAFLTLMMRYTGQMDIATAIPVANRDRVQLEKLIGFFVNTLVLRVDLSGDPSFRELLRRTRAVCLDAYSHQEMPFERLVEELHPKRDLSRSPLAQIIFQLEDIPKVSGTSRGVKSLDVDAGTAIYDIHIHLYEAWDSAVLERPEGIRGTFTYNSDIFEPQTIQRLLGHYRTLLESVLANPDRRIGEAPILPDTERRELAIWNQTAQQCGSDKSVASRFEQIVEQMPDTVAVVSGGRSFTYAELNQRANQLAHYLRRLGVGPEKLVGICLDRSVEMAVALLGVIKAGGAYVPLDSEYPGERLRLMLDDAKVVVTLTESALVERLGASGAGAVVCLDSDWDQIAMELNSNPELPVRAENLAYVVYTSGSTGKPKGVCIEHRDITNYFDAVSSRIDLGENLQFALVSTFAADLGNTVIYPALCGGGTLHIMSREQASQSYELAQYFQQNKIDCLKITPSHLAGLMAGEAQAGLIPAQRLIFGGEALPQDWVERLSNLQPQTQIFNHYGPTECTVGALTYRVQGRGSPTGGGTVPIGAPLGNLQAYLLDSQFAEVPVGVPGELYIGGAGVGRGYLNRADFTAERFLADPFSIASGARMYRTGDRGRRLSDGNIEFLGRLDDQVKIRGYRVELGEIENALSQHPGVEDAAVVVREDHGDRQLIACVVPRSRDLDSDESSETPKRVLEWKSIYEELYRQPSQGPDGTFSLIGWNSSYTGLPILEEQMRESVDCTVARIFSLQPRTVLEIGCGAGLLIFRIAPKCAEYSATDFSSSAISYVQQQVTRHNLSNVKLMNRPADDFNGLTAGSFDLIILNSVVQYFPDITYLLRVLKGAVKLVKAGGHIFIGDVRSLPLLETFHTSVELTRASASVPMDKLRRNVQRRLLKEEECVIDPAFFTAAHQHIPEITATEVQLKRGRSHNELTKFRYDVVLQVGGNLDPAKIDWLNWHEQFQDLSALELLLEKGRPEQLGIRGVSNARLQSDWKAAELFRQTDSSVPLGELKRVLEDHDFSSQEPEDFWSLGERLGYGVSVGWSGNKTPAVFDVLLRKMNGRAKSFSFGSFLATPMEASFVRPLRTYTNNPMRGIVARELTQQLRQRLEEKLPNYMVPAVFSIIDRLPLLPSGKVDRRALQEVDTEDTVRAETFIAPRDSFELGLARIWEETLNIQQISIRDSFFDLGGHSLLAVRVIGRVQKTFGQTLPLATLFAQPTIEQIAVLLRRGFDVAELSPLVALRETGTFTSLFLVHPAGGGVMPYYELARRFGSDRRLYGLQFQGFETRKGSVTTVEEMATHYIHAIQKTQANGPYLLGGWSLGGVIAFEMAKQLQARGYSIPLVLILDMRAPIEESRLKGAPVSESSALLSLAKKLEIYTGRQFQVSATNLDGLSQDEQLDYFVAEMKARNMVPEEVDSSWLRQFLDVYENNVNAVKAYAPGKYSGAVALFRGKVVLPEVEQEYPEIYRDPALGWGSLVSGDLAIYQVPGNHLSMIAAPNVQVLAMSMSESLRNL